MGSGTQLLFLSLILTNLVGLTIAQPDLLFNSCTETSNYTSNSTYQTNLNTLLSSLSFNTDKYGFYSSSVGENSDRVNAIVLCRGDVQLETCRSCINNATSKLIQVCPNQKEAIGCLDQFNNDLRTLLDSLRSQASSGDHRRKFAAGNTTAPEFKTIYGLEQCTPDLSEQQCGDCRTKAIEAIPSFCAGKQGGRFATPSCNYRFETYNFFNEIPADSPPPLGAPAEPAQPHVRPQGKNQTSRGYDVAYGGVDVKNASMEVRPEFEYGYHANVVKGSEGYMAPEYAMHGQFSVKSDVFSFGVLVLEIVSGQKNNCFQNEDNVEDLLSYAWKTWREGTISNLIDPALRDGSGSLREIMRCIHIGLLCVQENVVVRPTMASVVVMLNSFSLTLSLPLEPTPFALSTINSEIPLLQENNYVVSEFNQSKSKSTHMSVNEASITELYPR
ncbi:hypothetical protein TEA_008864 [Camellia sinensis var. sinensis]|uniref:Gnk2-homologous domain-containing protein n=1 Tax=Camellia sinensis var. sinensis TaxID=542762 RepID=A0A4V3WMN6_CAMSN|nr:hypothetical protein TEA_008864 [Camellia sinensis var. sinensis]